MDDGVIYSDYCLFYGNLYNVVPFVFQQWQIILLHDSKMQGFFLAPEEKDKLQPIPDSSAHSSSASFSECQMLLFCQSSHRWAQHVPGSHCGAALGYGGSEFSIQLVTQQSSYSLKSFFSVQVYYGKGFKLFPVPTEEVETFRILMKTQNSQMGHEIHPPGWQTPPIQPPDVECRIIIIMCNIAVESTSRHQH